MISDSEILRLLKDNNKIAFNSLYEKYAQLVYGWIMNLTDDAFIASSLFKKSFIDIWRDIKLYNPNRTTLFTWMIQVTMQNCTAIFQFSATTMNHKIKVFHHEHLDRK